MTLGFLRELALEGGAAAAALAPEMRHRLAVGLILASGLSMAGMMTALKLGAEVLSIWQIMVFMSGVPALCLLPVFRAARIPLVPPAQYGLYAIRIGCAAGAVVCWVYSLAYLPLGVATAISFAKGLFVLWLAAVLLAERITALKLTTTLLGCAGVLLVLDLSGGGSAFAGAVGVVGALFGALLSVVIKRLSATEPTLRMMFYPSAGIGLLCLGPALATWQPVGLGTLGLALTVALMGMISQWCFITAYRLSDVSALAPIEYSRLVIAVLTGFLVFNEVPSVLDLCGMLLIAGASYAAYRFGAVPPVGASAKP